MIYKEIRLRGWKGEAKKVALFDTGSTYSLIRKELAEKLNVLIDIEPLEMQTAEESTKITSKYKVILDFFIDGWRFSDEFVVCDNLSEEAIIGLTTLQKWHIKLDIENKEVIIDPRSTRIIAILSNGFSTPNELSASTFEPLIITFCCNWCSYAGADLAGVSRLKYPPNIRIIRVMCSGMIHPNFVMEALTKGADGVLVCGCHPGDCHYREGNLIAEKRAEAIRLMLQDFGIEEERFRLEWVSASEGHRFAQVVTEMTEQIRKLGPSPYL